MALAAYHVIGNGMTIETQLNAAGTGIEDVHVIPYMIDSGPAQGSRRIVKVPSSMYNDQAVRQAIEADLDATHKIASLGNPAS